MGGGHGGKGGLAVPDFCGVLDRPRPDNATTSCATGGCGRMVSRVAGGPRSREGRRRVFVWLCQRILLGVCGGPTMRAPPRSSLCAGGVCLVCDCVCVIICH